ncbi:hypothetical protein PCCS19_21090 [Paenibacillus sp. CCS19]|uniref:hypothetical protein n=1 Tax=Paenibacillus sp. CCS19 TaxID=3158387 RepID=UPI00255E28D3|nr:hypothetical protein [Paenibacillus cellulosilyticus]GMK39055.1 hypothetical protein PCCS19_21090 [Paenibacillus cellulosilyticus]
MFIIEAHNGSRTWISGILQDEEAAKDYFNSIPEDLKKFQSIISVSTLSYPFYIVEGRKSFRYLNRADVEGLFDRISKLDDEDHVYFNLYFIIQDYRHSEPGLDNMGILNHMHIDNRFLMNYQRYGMDLLVRNRMA